MDIAGYMNKKKLLGAEKSDILKYYELFAHKSKMDLVEALTLNNEAIFRIKIDENEEVILKDRIYEPLEKSVNASIDEYTDNSRKIWLTDLILKQNTPYNEFCLRIDLFAFANGKKIAIRNYGNCMMHPIRVGTFGYCIAFKLVYCGYARVVVIDNELNKYLCVSNKMPDYNKFDECEELYITYNYDNSYRLRVIEKIDKISMEQIEEIEIVY